MLTDGALQAVVPAWLCKVFASAGPLVTANVALHRLCRLTDNALQAARACLAAAGSLPLQDRWLLPASRSTGRAGSQMMRSRPLVPVRPLQGLCICKAAGYCQRRAPLAVQAHR